MKGELIRDTYYAYVKKFKPVGNREHPRSSNERFERVLPNLLHRTGDDQSSDPQGAGHRQPGRRPAAVLAPACQVWPKFAKITRTA